MDSVRHGYRYQLGYTGKQKICMKGLCILCLAISKTKTVFDVVDGAFDRCADLNSGGDLSPDKDKPCVRI